MKLIQDVTNAVPKPKKAKLVCPECQSRKLAHIVYGFPAFDKELEKKLDEGKIVLGGCEYNKDFPH